MEIVQLTTYKYQEWDNFCLASDDAWLWHTTKWLEYEINVNPKLQVESKSFLVYDNNKIVAICPLLLHRLPSHNEFSYGYEPGQTPAFENGLSNKERKRIMKFVFDHIDELAIENKVVKTTLVFPILNNSYISAERQQYNYLMQYNYLDTSINTNIIDLSISLDRLKKQLRHGHSSDIDRAKKSVEVSIYNHENINREVFDDFISVHYGVSERRDRPSITIEILYDFILENKAFLAMAKDGDNVLGFSYFYNFKNNVYYGASCKKNNSSKLPFSHYIQWKAIEWMKNNDFHYYELGWQEFGNTLSHFPSDKEVNISKFKRGFGGFFVPLFSGEKYYDKNFFLKEYQERINKYANQ